MNDTEITAFSRSFAAALRGVMTERQVRLRPLADHMGRSLGFVSERTGGIRPVDTDVVDAVAELGGVDTRWLIAEIARRMQADDLGPRDRTRSGDAAYRRGYGGKAQPAPPRDPADTA